MVRKYTITIRLEKDGSDIADNVLKDFGCIVSEPSEWLDQDLSTSRGLTFLDTKGNTLSSSIFKHQAYFNPQRENTVTEKAEIKELVYAAIREHYQLGPTDIKINVLETVK